MTSKKKARRSKRATAATSEAPTTEEQASEEEKISTRMAKFVLAPGEPLPDLIVLRKSKDEDVITHTHATYATTGAPGTWCWSDEDEDV